MNRTTTNAAATTTTTACRWAVIALLAASAGGCMSSVQSPSPRMAGDLALSVPVALRGATVEVTVTGTDMAEPVTGQLPVRDGVAAGRIDGNTAGTNRLVLITATDSAGRRCAREVTASVDALGVTELDGGVSLECEAPAALAISTAAARAQSFPPVL